MAVSKRDVLKAARVKRKQSSIRNNMKASVIRIKGLTGGGGAKPQDGANRTEESPPRMPGEKVGT